VTDDRGRPTVHTCNRDDVPAVEAAEGVVQRVMAGHSRGDGSPLLLGVTTVAAHRTSRLIEHDTAELAYVLSGSGWMVTDTAAHAFRAGDSILIDARCWHAIRAGENPVEMLYVFPTPAVPPTRQQQ
jgi:quercetin dioxygenase-like cupin family protein